MKLTITLASLAVIGVFAFQNCNKLPSSVGEAPDANQKAQVSRVDMSMADVSTVSFNIRETVTVSNSGHDYSVIDNKVLSINMQNGQLTERSDYTNNTRTFCLPDDMKSEMVSILEVSQVCKWGKVSGPDTMCGMAMQEPYAEVSMGDEIMGLGSATDTCGNNAVDLCDQRNEVLKAFIDRLNAAYTSYSCN